MKNFIKKHKFGLISLIVIFIVAIIYCLAKRDFYADECLTFALTNHPTGWLTYEPNGWFERDFFSDYVVKDKPFDYLRVYRNQWWDTHPPLHYYLLHTIFSFFPFRFSLWFGFFINIIFHIGIASLLYILIYKYTKKDHISAIGVLLYGLNYNVLQGVIFIRMYVMLSFFVLLFLIIGLRIVEQKEKSYINYLILFITVICGGLTHYHFYFAISIMSFIFMIVLIVNKNYKTLFISFILVFVAVTLNIFVIFPPTIYHLQNMSHVKNAASALISIDLDLERLGYYLCNAWSGCILVFFEIALFIYSLYKSIKKNKSYYIATIIYIIYFLLYILLAKTSTYIDFRYVLQTYSIGIFAFVMILYNISCDFKIKKIYGILFTVICVLLNFNIGFLINNLKTEPSWKFAKRHQDDILVVVNSKNKIDNDINTSFVDFRWYIATGMTHIGDDFDNSINNDFILYVDKDLNQKDAINYIGDVIKTDCDLEFNKENIITTYYTVYTVKFMK